jgi:hypothetical protein
MPLGYYGPGNWFGGAPELGFTETFLGGDTNSLYKNAPTPDTNDGPSTSSSVGSTVASPSTSGSVSGSTVNNAPTIQTTVTETKKGVDEKKKADEEAAKAAQEALRAQISAEYNNIMNSLSSQESQVRGQQPITEAQINQGYNAVTPQIQYEQQQRLSDYATQGQQAQQQTSGVLGQARQAYNELVSGASKFGGSAAQAYGELLGRSTAQTMGTARNNLTQTLNDIQGQVGATNQYYNAKLSDLETQKNNAILQSQQDMRNQLAQINNSRNQSQQWKASQNVQALASFKQQVATITNAAVTAKQTLDQWALEQQQALKDAQSQVVKQFQLTPTNVSDIASRLSNNSMTGVVAPSTLANVYGLIGQNASDVNWNDVLGVTNNSENTSGQNVNDIWNNNNNGNLF